MKEQINNQQELGDLIFNNIKSIKSKYLTEVKTLDRNYLAHCLIKGIDGAYINYLPLTTAARSIGRLVLHQMDHIEDEKKRAITEVNVGIALLKVLKKAGIISWGQSRKKRDEAKSSLLKKDKLSKTTFKGSYKIKYIDEEWLLKATLMLKPQQEIVKLWNEPQYGELEPRTGFYHPVGGALIRKCNPSIQGLLNRRTSPRLFNAINKMRNVEFNINIDILNIIKSCIDDDILSYNKKKITQQQRNSLIDADARAIKVADDIGDRTFKSEVFADFRYRLYYAITGLNPAASSLEKSLILMEPSRIGTKGLKALKQNTTAQWGEDKLNIKDRVKFCDDRMDEWMIYASDPLNNKGWQKADKPLLFIASCIELYKAYQLNNPADYASGLPISIDASTSGLQVLSALSRDEITGELCNLSSSTKRADSYIKVADLIWNDLPEVSDADRKLWDGLKANIIKLKMSYINAETPLDIKKAKRDYDYYISSNSKAIKNVAYVMWSDLHENRRKLVKRLVMTRFYNAKVGCMADQLAEDFEADYPEMTTHHTWVLANKVFDACSIIFPRAVELMKLFGELGNKAYKSDEDLSYNTIITGAPMTQYYREDISKLIDLVDVNGSSFQLRVNVGKNAKIKYNDVKKGTAPNIVHNFDGLIVCEAYNSVDYDIYTIHDAFLTTPSNYYDLRIKVREVFIEVFNDDRLKELCEQMDAIELYDAIKMGSLNIGNVLKNDYCFD